MRIFQKHQCLVLFLLAVFIVLLFNFQGISFLKLELFKPRSFKTNNQNLESKWNSLREKKNTSEEALSSEITILTAYFNLGSFRKGKYRTYTSQHYIQWMKVFGRINNKMVLYTDDKAVYELLRDERKHFPKEHTQLFLINRTTLWSFRIKDRIANIFKQPGYPIHYPNTVLPEYSCAMHAKFELLAKVIKRNYYKTKYFMWLDIGLFRDLKGSFAFGMSVPKNFDESKVAYSYVYRFRETDYKTVVEDNLVWVCGATNLGRHDILYTFTQEYLQFIKKSLKRKCISTDQQAIYGMFLEKKKPKTQFQLYNCGWFCLGYTCYKAWIEKQLEKQNQPK